MRVRDPALKYGRSVDVHQRPARSPGENAQRDAAWRERLGAWFQLLKELLAVRACQLLLIDVLALRQKDAGEREQACRLKAGEHGLAVANDRGFKRLLGDLSRHGSPLVAYKLEMDNKIERNVSVKKKVRQIKQLFLDEKPVETVSHGAASYDDLFMSVAGCRDGG